MKVLSKDVLLRDRHYAVCRFDDDGELMYYWGFYEHVIDACKSLMTLRRCFEDWHYELVLVGE